MKDFDDFDDYNNEETPRSRAMSWVVLAIALSGFVALAWYAYHSGSQSVTDGQMVVIKADETPIKEKPADAGGEQFPHQDKTIYDTISPYRTDKVAKVEKLLPEPEEPIIEEEAPTATKTWVNDKIRSVSDAEEKINEQLDKTTAKKEEAKTVEVKKEEPKKEVIPPAPVAKKEEPKVEEKKIVAEAPKVEPAKEVKKEEPKAAAPAPTVSSGSGYKIQLGAYGSQAEAEQNWARISSKHAGILGGFSHVIVKADVPGKGTFYRLRASGFETPDSAKQACTKLSAAGQGCFYAGR